MVINTKKGCKPSTWNIYKRNSQKEKANI